MTFSAQEYDVVIIGGGVIGSSIAFFLSQNRVGSVCVVERDPCYREASSSLSASSIRQQFTTPLNVRMSQYGFEFLSNIENCLSVDGDPVDVGLVERGYLILSPVGLGESLKSASSVQRSLGAHTEVLETVELEQRYPWLNASDLELATYGARGEGWFDGYALLQAFKHKARANGVTYLTAEVTALESTCHQVTAAHCRNGAVLRAGIFVNACGPHAARACSMLEIDLPVSARKRDVFMVECAEKIAGMPMIFDTTGAWVRPEGRGYICGKAPDPGNDPPDTPLSQVDYNAFEEVIWPILAHRIPAFEALKVRSSWAGYYAVNYFDHNAVLGLHPKFRNFVLANGFSGHGMQQAPAVGRGIAELIEHGEYRSLDLSPFCYERIAAGNRIVESVVW